MFYFTVHIRAVQQINGITLISLDLDLDVLTPKVRDTPKVSNKSGLKRGGLEQTAANACKNDQAPELT